MTTAIWWVRRDQRLTDNQALAAALEQAEQVIPVFVLDPVLMSAPNTGGKRVAFMLGGLRQLEADLQSRGSGLIVRRGDPAAELATLVQETGAQAIFAEEDYWPYARQRDGRIAQSLPLQLVGGLTVHPPGMVLKADGTPYTVFTPFSRTWKALAPPEAEVAAGCPGVHARASRASQSADPNGAGTAGGRALSTRRGRGPSPIACLCGCGMADLQPGTLPISTTTLRPGTAWTWTARPGSRPTCALGCSPPARRS